MAPFSTVSWPKIELTNTANIVTYPASASVQISADTTFYALYKVPVHVVTLGVYEEGSFAMWFCARVITGDPLISDATWQWRSSGGSRIVEKWSFENETFDVTTAPITADIVNKGFDANGDPKSMVKAYLAKPDGSSLAASGLTGISALGNLVGSNIPENVMISLGATTVTSGESHNALVGKMGSGTLAGMYEVNLAAGGSSVHNEFGSLALTFPIDAAYNGRGVTVHHRHNDGSITSEKAVAKNGAVTVTVTDLSAFALEVEASEEVKPLPNVDSGATAAPNSSSLAQTGDPMSMLVLFGGVIASGAVLAFARHRSRIQAQK